MRVLAGQAAQGIERLLLERVYAGPNGDFNPFSTPHQRTRRPGHDRRTA